LLGRAGMSSLAESILEQKGDAVIYADETGTIRRWNAAAAMLFGYSAAEAIGQTLDLIVPAHLLEAQWRGLDAAITSGVVKLNGRPTLTRAVTGMRDGTDDAPCSNARRARSRSRLRRSTVDGSSQKSYCTPNLTSRASRVEVGDSQLAPYVLLTQRVALLFKRL